MADRVQQLLKTEREGRLTKDEQVAIGVLRAAGEFPPATTPATATRGLRRPGLDIPGELDPAAARWVGAETLRLAPGLAANPLIAGPLSAGGEALAQQIEGSPVDPVAIGAAGAMPPLAAGIVRGARALGRTATRMSPTLFRRAHEGAQETLGTMAEGMRPALSPAVLFGQAGDLGGEAIMVTSTREMLKNLEAGLPGKPVNEGLKKVRQHMSNIGELVGDSPAIRLDELMKVRRDLGRSVAERGAAPEMKAIYKGIMQDLEVAAAAGGAGATVTREALTAFKRDLGIARFREFAELATSRRAIAGADTPILNVSKLSDLVSKNSGELTKLLGPESREMIGAFINRFRSLPPEHAANATNILLTGIIGGAGLAGSMGAGMGPLGIGLSTAGAAVAQELSRNAFAVGRNPKELNRLVNMVTSAARWSVSETSQK